MNEEEWKVLDDLARAYRKITGLDGAYDAPLRAAENLLKKGPVAPVAQPVSEPSNALGYATRLAVSLHASLYPDVVQWKPLPDLLGVLTQIDNMVCGIALRPAVKTQPLTDEQVAAMFEKAGGGFLSLREARVIYARGLRDGERAHRIGQKGADDKNPAA